MRHFLAILIATIAIAILGFPCYAEAKPTKASPVKIHMCESVDLYSGPVTAGTHTDRIAEACRDVSIKAATKAIDACTSEGPEVCEVLYTADRKTLLIEHKISTAGGGK